MASTEIQFDKLNDEIAKLNRQYDEMAQRSVGLASSLDKIGNAVETLGSKFGNVSGLANVFDKFQQSAKESLDKTSSDFNKSMDDITSSMEALSKSGAFSKGISFIDPKHAQIDIDSVKNKLRELETEQERLYSNASKAISVVGGEEQLSKNIKLQEIFIQSMEKEAKLNDRRKDILDYHYNRLSLLKDKQDEIYGTYSSIEKIETEIASQKQILIQKESELSLINKTNEGIITMAASYEPVIEKVRQLQEEFDKLAASGKLEYDEEGELIGKGADLNNEIAQLEENNKLSKQAYEYVNGMIEKESDLASIQEDIKRNRNEENALIKKGIELNEKMLSEEQERLEKERNAALEKQRKTPQGALSYSSTATTLEQDRQAIKYLTEAREKLDRNDKNYKQTLEQLNSAIKNHEKNISEVTGKTRQFNNENSKLIPKLKELAGAIGIAYGVQGIANFVRKVVEVTGEFELQTVAIGSIVGSLSKASDIFGEIQSMALKSPFTVKQLTEQTKKLSAYRIETEKLLPTLKQLGDISSGLGVDINRLILAYGQVKAANYLRGQELRQFSEAGVNILGELAKYFSEIEGRVVRVGDVFGMVSARMVTFEDVAEVFDRLTKKGGVFYKMQEKQAETISGKISNLKDAWLLLLNSIGSSQSGFIKGFLNGLQWLILNIGKLTDIILQLGAAVAVFKVAEFIKVNSVLNILKTRIVGITGALKSMWAVIAANPILAVISALAALAVKIGVASIQYKKACKEISEAQIELSAKIRRETESVEEMWKNMATPDLRGMRDSIETLFQKFRDEGLIVKNPLASKGFESETEEGLRKMLETMKKDAEKANAIMAEAGKVSAESFWTNLFKWDMFRSFFDPNINARISVFKGEMFSTDIEDYDSRLKNMISNSYKLSDVINELDEKGFSSKTLEELRKIDEAENKTVLDYERQAELIGKLKEELSSSSSIKEKDLVYWKDIKQAVKDYIKYRKASIELEMEMQWAMGNSPYFKNINYNEVYTNEEKRIEYIQKKLQFLKGAAKGIMTITPEMENDYITKWNDALNKISGTKISVDVLLNPTTENKELANWQVDYNRFINELEMEFANKFDLTTKKYTETSQKLSKLFGASGDELKKYSEHFDVEFLEIIRNGNVSYNEVREKMRNRIKDVQQVRRDIKKIIGDVKADSKEGRSIMQYLVDNLGINDPRLVTKQGFLNIALVNSMLNEVDSMNERISNYLLLGDKKEPKGSKKSYKPEFESMIRFIRQLYSETEKLNKTFDNTDSIDGWTASLKRVRDSFGGEFEAMPKDFKKLFSDLMTNVDFSDPLAMSKQLEKLKQLAKTGKYRPEMSEIIRLIEKNIAEVKTDIDVKLKIKSDAELNRQIERMFANYQISLDLMKSGISESFARGFFNIDYTTLDKLQDRIFSLRDSFIGEDQVKKYREYVKKLYDITDKAQAELVKKYAKYLEYEMGNAVNIEMKYAKMRSEALSLPIKEEGEMMRILEGINREYEAEKNKQRINDFKSSEMYIKVFEDLNRVSVNTLKMMRQRIEDMVLLSKDLSPEQIKTLVGEIEKIDDTLRKRNPYKSLIESHKKWVEYKDKIGSDENLLGISESGIKKADKIYEKALNDAYDRLEKIRKERIEAGTKYKEAQRRDDALKALGLDLDWLNTVSEDDIEKVLSANKKIEEETLRKLTTLTPEEKSKLEDEKLSIQKKIEVMTDNLERSTNKDFLERTKNAIKTLRDRVVRIDRQLLTGIRSETGDEKRDTDLELQYSNIQQQINAYSQLFESVQKLQNEGATPIEALKKAWDKLSESEKNALRQVGIYQDGVNAMTSYKDSISEFAKTFNKFASDFGNIFKDVLENIYVFDIQLTEKQQVTTQAISETVDATMELGSAVTEFFDSAMDSQDKIGLIMSIIEFLFNIGKMMANANETNASIDISKIEKNVEKLSRSYGKLSKAFNDAYDIDRLSAFNAEMQYATQQQIDYLEQMIYLEREKKKTDEEKIEQWERDIDDLSEQLAETSERFYEELGGFGSEANYKDAAQQFVDAWYDAFMETGDGLSGLEETFDGFLENLIKKQLMRNIMSKYITDILTGFDELVAKEGGIIGNRSDWVDYLNGVQESMQYANEDLKAAMDIIKGIFGVSGDLEGLQQGIQGMTESTAEALTGYLNSIWLYVAEQNEMMLLLSDSLTSQTNNDGILSNIRLIANNTSAIQQLFSSVIKSSGHSIDGGAGIRVFVD